MCYLNIILSARRDRLLVSSVINIYVYTTIVRLDNRKCQLFTDLVSVILRRVCRARARHAERENALNEFKAGVIVAPFNTSRRIRRCKHQFTGNVTTRE